MDDRCDHSKRLAKRHSVLLPPQLSWSRPATASQPLFHHRLPTLIPGAFGGLVLQWSSPLRTCREIVTAQVSSGPVHTDCVNLRSAHRRGRGGSFYSHSQFPPSCRIVCCRQSWWWWTFPFPSPRQALSLVSCPQFSKHVLSLVLCAKISPS